MSVLFIFLGSILKSDLVWGFADLFNYLMVIPNVFALMALSGMVVDEIKKNGKRSIEKPNEALSDSIKGEKKI